MCWKNVAILDLRLTAFRVHLLAITVLLEVTLSEHCSYDSKTAGRNDPFVSEYEFDVVACHGETSGI